MFSSMIKVIDDKGRAVKAFSCVAKDAYEKAVSDPEHAAAYLMLAIVADKLADQYYECILLDSHVDKEFKRLLTFADNLDKAYASADVNETLKAVSDVARQIASNR
ncbi:hypothetical protein ABCW43_26020 [Neorhizobium sp. IRAMC:178]|uniref:hypothetical protein n=1 Tax=Neorhizobium tunisiense TaxID=3144793 RepID=UPI0031F6CF89